MPHEETWVLSGRNRVRALAVATIIIFTFTSLVFPTTGYAQQPLTADEELAQRFAPYIILQRQDEPCDDTGEPYLPAPVNVAFSDPAVILRQGPDQLPASSPVENPDLFDLPNDYATDFPGKPRFPGCDYETHFKAVMGDQRPVVYAHVATEEGRPGIVLQYWSFWYFNDFNNVHEGDWEMIQLRFDADSVEEALQQEPVAVAFAQHSGGETAAWNAPKLEKEGTRPLVYASRGSHASYYGPGLWLGWGQDGSGLGCDITNGEQVRIDPEVRLIPESVPNADDPFSWITFAGHWGERETWVYDGPTGPAFKTQWSAPITWMEGLRADSLRVNAGSVLGPNPADFFCGAVQDTSMLITLAKPYPLITAAIVAAGLALVIAVVRLSWANLRRTWQFFRAHFGIFVKIGALTIPATLVVSLVQYLLGNSEGFAALTSWTEDGPAVEALLSGVSLLQQALLFLVVTPAVIQAVGDIRAGRQPGVWQAIRESWRHLLGYIWTGLRNLIIVALLFITVIGIPWGINRTVRWLFGGQAAILTGTRGKEALAESSAAVKGNWWQAAANSAMFAFIGSAPGIGIALLALVLLRAPLDAANGLAAVVYAVAQPFAIVGMTLLFLHWRQERQVNVESAAG